MSFQWWHSVAQYQTKRYEFTMNKRNSLDEQTNQVCECRKVLLIAIFYFWFVYKAKCKFPQIISWALTIRHWLNVHETQTSRNEKEVWHYIRIPSNVDDWMCGEAEISGLICWPIREREYEGTLDANERFEKKQYENSYSAKVALKARNQIWRQ